MLLADGELFETEIAVRHDIKVTMFLTTAPGRLNRSDYLSHKLIRLVILAENYSEEK